MATITYVDKSATSTVATVNYNTDLVPPNDDNENSYGIPSYSWSGDFSASSKSGQASVTLIAGQPKVINATVTATASYSYRYWIDAVPPDKDDEGNDIPGTGSDGHWSKWYSGTPWSRTESASSNPIYAHPAEFHLTYGDTLDRYLSASQWNNAFSTAIQQYLSWKQQSPQSFSNVVVKKDDIIGAAAYNQAAHALGQPEINSHDRIKTSLFETLIGELNNGV